MSIEANAYVWHLTAAPDGTALSLGEKMVLLVLGDHHNPTHRVAWPSIRTIAKLALMSERQVQNILRVLERRGLISTDVHARSFGRGHTPQYILVGLEKGAGYAPFSGAPVASKAAEKPVERLGKSGSGGTVKGEERVQEEGRKGCKKGAGGDDAIRKNLEPTTELETKAAPAVAVAPTELAVNLLAGKLWGKVLLKLKDRLGIGGTATYDALFRDTAGERIQPPNGTGRHIMFVRCFHQVRPDQATMYRWAKDVRTILKGFTGNEWHVSYLWDEGRRGERRP